MFGNPLFRPYGGSDRFECRASCMPDAVAFGRVHALKSRIPQTVFVCEGGGCSWLESQAMADESARFGSNVTMAVPVVTVLPSGYFE